MPNASKPKLEVCLSPALLHLYDTKDTVAVIIDVFRATSTIVTALANGAKAVYPVAEVEECIAKGESIPNSVTAGERNGKVAEGLQYGNSPAEYPATFVKDKNLILTTTNGTKLLHMVKDAAEIVIGSFLNLDALCDFLVKEGKPVLLGCSGWKDRFNLEDSLFAGAVVDAVVPFFDIRCDSALAVQSLYNVAKPDVLVYLKNSSHWHRLSAYGLQDDMAYCATLNLHPVVPILRGEALILEP